MNEQAFLEYLQRTEKRENRRARAVKSVRKFERYLSQMGKAADQAEPVDLEQFLERHARESVAKYEVYDLWRYYDATGNDRMKEAVDEMRYRFTPPFKLDKFLGIAPSHIETLKGLGIRTNNQLLYAADTPEKRTELAEETGIPLVAILELVRLSDLARLPGVKGIRARLYYDAGVDCAAKMAAWEPEALLKMTTEFVEQTGFDGIAPLPKEVRSTITNAKRLPKIVEY